MYVEGFVIPVRTARKEDYLKFSRKVAAVYRDHGAARVVECWGTDTPLGEDTSFPRAVALEGDETVVFSWIEYPDKTTRDACHERIWADPLMTNMTQDASILDGRRMIFGGFVNEIDV